MGLFARVMAAVERQGARGQRCRRSGSAVEALKYLFRGESFVLAA